MIGQVLEDIVAYFVQDILIYCRAIMEVSYGIVLLLFKQLFQPTLLKSMVQL